MMKDRSMNRYYELKEALDLVHKFTLLAEIFLTDKEQFSEEMCEELYDIIMNKRKVFERLEELYYLETGNKIQFMKEWDKLVSVLTQQD
jgi:hypothetical protein